jgi:hypothetical protein
MSDYLEEEVEEELSAVPIPGLSKEEQLRIRILDTLEIYPRLSPSMLQAGIGPHNSPRIWRPIMEQLINSGIIIRGQESHQSELGRYRTIIVLSLSDKYREERIQQLREQATSLEASSENGELLSRTV